MGLLEDFGNMAKQMASGNASAADVHSAYDQVAPEVNAAGHANARRSARRPPPRR